MTQRPGIIALFGSGEMADSMAEVHRQLMSRLGEPAQPVFIDTPAGFELNIDRIGQKAADYFRRNFNLELPIARYRHPSDGPEQMASAVRAIQNANYLFAGPGSASYAVRLWRSSPVWDAVIRRWQSGAAIVFSSAAALTLGAHTLPVYEIYKVGEDPHWIDGLDLLGQVGLKAAVVPHWNNASGDQHDTRFCFMGGPRFEELEGQLPADALVLGVDEYAAAVLDVTQRQGEVLGSGQVTLRQGAHQRVASRGERFALVGVAETAPVVEHVAVLNAPVDPAGPDARNDDITALRQDTQRALEAGDFGAGLNGLVALSLIAGAGLEQGVFDRAEMSVQSLQALLPALAHLPMRDREADGSAHALVELLVSVRGALREAKQWALADQVRDELARLGYALTDTADGTHWSKEPGK